MRKAAILKGYSVDESKYKRVCFVLGVNESDFPSDSIDHFEIVLGWFEKEKGLQDADAKARYEKELRVPLSASEMVDKALEPYLPVIETRAAELIATTENILSDLQQKYVSAVYAVAGKAMIRESEKMRSYPMLNDEKSASLPPGG